MASERMTVARAMVKALEAEGITTVFGYPGAAICPFYDELISSDIRHVRYPKPFGKLFCLFFQFTSTIHIQMKLKTFTL